MKMSIGKVPVVPLHQANEFMTWQLALRRLVTTYNMADALLYSVPSNQLTNYQNAALHPPTIHTELLLGQLDDSAEAPQPASNGGEASGREAPITSSSSSGGSDLTPDPAGVERKTDESVQPQPQPRQPHLRTAATTGGAPTTTTMGTVSSSPTVNNNVAQANRGNAALMASLGITSTITEFFSASVRFVDARALGPMKKSRKFISDTRYGTGSRVPSRREPMLGSWIRSCLYLTSGAFTRRFNKW